MKDIENDETSFFTLIIAISISSNHIKTRSRKKKNPTWAKYKGL